MKKNGFADFAAIGGIVALLLVNFSAYHAVLAAELAHTEPDANLTKLKQISIDQVSPFSFPNRYHTEQVSWTK